MNATYLTTHPTIDRAFAAAGPGLWNSLPIPSHLKEVDLLYNRFQRSLKTILFGYRGTMAQCELF